MPKSRGLGGKVQRVGWQSPAGWVAKSRGLGGKVQRVGCQSPEGWVANSRGLGGKVKRVGWQSLEGWVAKSGVLVGKVQVVGCRGLQRDVTYLGRPIAPSYMSPNAGGESCGVSLSANEYRQLYTGAQINFGDLTPFLTYG